MQLTRKMFYKNYKECSIIYAKTRKTEQLSKLLNKNKLKVILSWGTKF